jgi:hypothetical protein
MSAGRMRIGIAMALGLALSTCNDPVHDAQVAALGPEDPGTPVGENHRPGQPCLVCHGDLGPARRFAVGGTVYLEDPNTGDKTTPVSGATVTLTDAAQTQVQATTNDAGNFYIRFEDWEPVFPITPITVVGSDPNNPAEMITHIGRDGSCGSCHYGQTPTAASPGPIYLTTP